MSDAQTVTAQPAVSVEEKKAEPIDEKKTDNPSDAVVEAKSEDKPAAADQPVEQNQEADASQVESNKVRICLKALKNIERDLQNVIKLLDTQTGTVPEAQLQLSGISMPSNAAREMELAGLRPVEGRIVEGVFDGSNMVGSDGKIYTVPANYASKSKLVEGDMLKLTITPKGSFIYKQIGPIERSRVVGTLGFDPTTGEYYTATENRRWSVIKASITYFKGDPGDEVVMLVPKNAPSKWAAVENIIKKSPLPA